MKRINENIELSNLPEKFSVRVHDEYQFDLLMNFFKTNQVVWNSGNIADEITFKSSFNYITYNYNGKKRLAYSTTKLGEEISLKDIISIKNLIPKKKNKEVDPFEEEDWGYKVQESIENFDDMTKYVYQFNNIEECRIVANGLIDLGYSIFNYDKIMTDDDLERYNCFTWGRPFRRFSRGVIYHLDQVITFEEFSKMFLSGKKISRITNTEVDPFEEEDWGYRVQEKKIDFDEKG